MSMFVLPILLFVVVLPLLSVIFLAVVASQPPPEHVRGRTRAARRPWC